MNILMVTCDYLPNIGGIASHVHYLSRSLIDLGHNVVILDPRSSWLKTDYTEIDGVKIIRLSTSNEVKVYGYLNYSLQVNLFLRRNGFYKKFDIIHWHDFITNALSTKFIKTKKVYTNHTSTYLTWYQSTICKIMMTTLLKHSNAVIAVSKELQEKSNIICDKKNIFYVSNGVDINKFTPDNELRCKWRKENGIDREKFIVLCARRWVYKNGIEYLIRSIPKCIQKEPNILFCMAGSSWDDLNEYSRKIRKIIKDLDIEKYILLLGNVPNSNMPALYNAADLTILPSLQEATSIAGLESLACETPVIGTNIGGIPEIIKDGNNGYLVPAKNSKSLEEAILKFIKEPHKIKEMGKEGRKNVEQCYSWNAIAKKTEIIYKQIVNR